MAEQNTNLVGVPIVGATIIPDQKSSVELTKNAKGEVQWNIKVYDIDPEKALAMALELKKSLEENLKQ